MSNIVKSNRENFDPNSMSIDQHIKSRKVGGQVYKVTKEHIDPQKVNPVSIGSNIARKPPVCRPPVKEINY